MWDWFIGLLTNALQALANLCGDWGVAIILLTVFIRLLLLPLSVRQIQSSAKMSQFSPRLAEIQEKYADNPMRQQEEMNKLYTENGFNPLGGCLPTVLQMPIFFALFSVLRNVDASASFLNIIPSLGISAQDKIGEVGYQGAIVYIVLCVLFGVLTFVPMALSSSSADEDTRKQTLSTGAIMALLMVWMGWRLPAGVLLYYITSSGWGAIQQLIVGNNVRNQIRAEAEAAAANAPVQVDVVRKQKKARPRKKS